MKGLGTVFALWLSFSLAEAIMFHLPVGLIKCLKNEGGKNALVVGEYNVTQIDSQQVDLLVTDSRRHVLANLKNIGKGKFTFVMETEDLFEICFSSKGLLYHKDLSHTVEMNLKRGVEARNDEELAKAEKLKPLEADIVYAENLADSIVDEFVTMKARHDDLESTNESTMSRLLYLGIFNVFWLFFTTATQVKYLHNYFKSKKLVE